MMATMSATGSTGSQAARVIQRRARTVCGAGGMATTKKPITSTAASQ